MILDFGQNNRVENSFKRFQSILLFVEARFHKEKREWPNVKSGTTFYHFIICAHDCAFCEQCVIGLAMTSDIISLI